MTSGWRYRIAAVVGTALLTAVAVLVASTPVVETLVGVLPVLGNLPVGPQAPGRLRIEMATALVVVLAAFAPLYKPRPRRILDTLTLAQKRVALAGLALATIGYFDFSFRLPRLTLILSGAMLFVGLPAWFLLIRRRPSESGGRAVIVGDDPESIADILGATDRSVVGYVSPPTSYAVGDTARAPPAYADGGVESRLDELPCLGGLSRLDEVLVDHDIDTAVLAFDRLDRAEFFGTLDTCYEHGVTGMIHRDHADVVLTRDTLEGDLVEVDLEPWDWQDHVIKRAFDVGFAGAVLVLSLPVVVAIAAAIKLDDGGPVFYSQERTAAFGDTFTVYKFRTMRAGGEDCTPTEDGENDRITPVGRVLRAVHLDELPQLWAILWGQMSVVGPRAAWTDEERHLEDVATNWRKRWFVEPGLTGLAQINNASSLDPEAKLRYDVEYIRQQSFWFDVKIVVRQLWMVVEDSVNALR